MKLSLLHRLLLLFTALLAAFLVATGIEPAATVPMLAYTIAFGVLLVASILLMILGFETLESPLVVVISTIIPLGLSLGLVWEIHPAFRVPYLVFSITGLIAIIITRLIPFKNKLPVIVLAIIHGIAGLIIFLVPIVQVAILHKPLPFALIGLGGALIGVGGLLLALLKTGRPVLSRDKIFNLFPALLLLMTLSFVAGFVFGRPF